MPDQAFNWFDPLSAENRVLLGTPIFPVVGPPICWDRSVPYVPGNGAPFGPRRIMGDNVLCPGVRATAPVPSTGLNDPLVKAKDRGC